jgi:hypothetical protein
MRNDKTLTGKLIVLKRSARANVTAVQKLMMHEMNLADHWLGPTRLESNGT